MPGSEQITIFTIAWNEEFFLPFFIAHYRKNFPDCRIVVYDNESTDNTKDIALTAGCEVETFNTGNTLSDHTYLAIKNNCWKTAQTDWVMVCDIDELCQITEEDLTKERGSVIRFQGWNLVNQFDNMDVASMSVGVRAPSYDKLYCFKRTEVQEINYLYGCHRADPRGNIKMSAKLFKCFHYKYINLDYIIKRHALFAARMSEHNREKGLGIHYLYTPEEITKEFNEARRNAK